MRVLHLDIGRDMRGGQWQALRLIEGLLASGIECPLLARAEGPLLAEARRRGWDASPISLLAVWRESRRSDLVHAHDARSHTFAAIAGRAPLIVARRVAFPIGGGWKYRRAACYIAVSQFVAAALESGGVPRHRIHVVYDGIPLIEGDSVRSSIFAPDNLDDPMKGAPLLARAAELAGVEVHYSADLQHDIRGAAIFVYLSHSEGLGSAVLLAMSAGATVIASDVGGLPEIVTHHETGMLVDNTPQAVGGAIRELLEKPEYARRLAAAARRRVEKEFTVELMVQRTLAVYRQVLAC